MCVTTVQNFSFDSFLQLIGMLVIFIFVLGITYVTTIWISGYQKAHTYNKNLKIIEILKITSNKYIQIIEAGEEYLVIAIGKDEVRLLTKLTKEQLKELPPEGLPAGKMPEIFQNLLHKLKIPKWKKNSTESFQKILEKSKKQIPKK